MDDYTELVKDLQYLAKVYSLNEREEAIESKLAVKAADAIKELLAQKEWYKTAYIKAHDASVEEITISHRLHGCDPDLQYEDYVK